MGVPGTLPALILGFLGVFWGVPAGAGDCKGQRRVLRGPRGFVTDGPGNYSVNGNCEWLIEAPSPRHRILLTFTFMDTECTYDYLFVYDGGSTRSPLLAALSGSALPAPLEATSGKGFFRIFALSGSALPAPLEATSGKGFFRIFALSGSALPAPLEATSGK
ncbi:multiple epidermal growth factor-like domains protein 8, partial [Cyanistes caeruleus]|uniref:multiple epidermal growth factor-like domains protein 8 n=1 Tax=Cyanistes caeruleus TaxID=156563 RepID=UPI000CDA9B57